VDAVTFALTLVTALACALTAGVFFAFSSFVMRALGRLHPPEGAAAMQAINVTAVSPAFMTVLFGPVVTLLVLVFVAWSPWIAGAGVAYLVGTVGLTIGYHVPHNDRLAALDPNSDEARHVWGRYCVQWTRWNHVRATAALLAAAALVVAIHVE
jgi:uncharacterized membrane protein